ncbi:MAG: hypothetical protein R3362_11945 [Rhodothermales bacterium]|nr:hypothetical protein [Rhodothermales bacterium]
MRPRFAFLALSLLAACGDADVPLATDPADEVATTTVSGLDSLVGRGVQVSVNGQVVDQEAGERVLTLDDGTGLVLVTLPEAPPMLIGRRLFARGPLDRHDGAVVLEAVEWLYDSTAVSARSE